MRGMNKVHLCQQQVALGLYVLGDSLQLVFCESLFSSKETVQINCPDNIHL